MIKVALIGYGQMGKLLEKKAPEYDAEIVSIIDPLLNTDISDHSVMNADVCIDFSVPKVVADNIKRIASLKKNIVVGTTGWLEKLPEIEETVRINNIGLIYGANFSPGMNLFFDLTAYLAKLMDTLPEYDVWGLEKHHNKKVDSPSGTAKVLTEILLKNLNRKKVGQFDKLDRKIDPAELHFASLRSGSNPGEHIIGFDSSADTIEIKHTARNREGLAIGALKAAEWIKNKKGIYNFQDVFHDLIKKEIK